MIPRYQRRPLPTKRVVQISYHERLLLTDADDGSLRSRQLGRAL